MIRYPQRDISEHQNVCQTLGITLGPICVVDPGYQTGEEIREAMERNNHPSYKRQSVFQHPATSTEEF